MGELHLEIIVDRLLREFKVEANVGRPQVAYRETITRAAEAEGKYIRQTGGRGQYGHVLLHVAPGRRARASSSRTPPSAASIPREFVPAVERGVREALARGVLAGYPVIDVEVTLTGGSYHEVDSARWPSRSPGSMGSGGARARRGPSCSSRSWRSRS